MPTRDRRRAVARILFENPEIFFNPEVKASGPLNAFDSALFDAVADSAPLNIEGSNEPRVEQDLIDTIRDHRTLLDLLRFVSANKLLSGQPDIGHFCETWFVVRGFDIDMLVAIGDPDGAAQSTKLARLELRERFERVLRREGDEARADSYLADGHVHYGQLIDMNVLWGLQIASGLKHPIISMRAQGSLQRKMSAALNRATRARWQEKLQCCRYLLLTFASFLASRDRSVLATGLKEVKEAVQSGYEARLIDPFAMAATERTKSLFSEIDRVRELEGMLVAVLNSKRADDAELELALLYVLMKNAVFSSLLQNRILDFPQFTSRLKDLDLLYAGIGEILEKAASLDFIERFVKAGGVRGGPIKVRVASSLDMMKDVRSVRMRIKNLDRRVVLAIKRDDIERLEEIQRKLFRDNFARLISLFAEDGIEVEGIDLIGPELRQSDAGIHLRPGETAARHARETARFIFEVRDSLLRADNRERYATFHCGEYCPDARVSLLTLLMIVSDQSFDARIDRLSHALVLHEPNEIAKVQHDKQTVRDAIDLLRKAILENLGRGPYDRRPYLSAKRTRSKIQRYIDAIADAASEPALPRGFFELQAFVRGLVEAGEINVEVCPSSNAMIRRDLVKDVARHPWATLVGKDNMRVGTDDPSLTQTLPWMEHAFLKAGATSSAT